MDTFTLQAIGVIRSPLRTRAEAPKQSREGAPDAWLVLDPRFAVAARDVAVGDEMIVLTWFHHADRGTLEVHPRSDPRVPLTGVFSTRSPDRPNPIGLHRVTVLERRANELKIGPLEAIDGTPVVDLKPVLND